jgi:hypothetical protein
MYFCRVINKQALKQLFLTVFLLFFVVSNTFPAGLTLFHFTDRSSYTFSYGRNDNVRPDNFFVREIARINYLNLYRTNYTLIYDIDVRVEMDEDGVLRMISRVEPIQINGDVHYRYFNLGDVLLPDVYSLTLKAYHHDQLICSISPANLAAGETQVVKLPDLSGTEPHWIRFFTSGVQFSYTADATPLFNERITRINEFLAFRELATLANKKAEAIDPEAQSDWLATHIAIYDLERFRQKLQREKAHSSLIIPTEYHDIAASADRQLDAHLRRLRNIFTKTVEAGEIFFDSATYAASASGVINLQLGYLDAMQKTSHFYEPVYKQMAGFFDDPDGWEDFMQNAQAAFPMIDPALFRVNFATHLHAQYLQATDSLFAMEKYNEALLMLLNAREICNANPELDCGMEGYYKLARARYGIYDAHLRIAGSAMDAGNLHLARRYLNIAAEYQLQNAGLIIIPDAVNRRFEQLAWRYFEAGRQAVRDEKIDEAFTNLHAAREIYHSLNLQAFDEAILQELRKLNRLTELQGVGDAVGAQD